jgi:cytochrome bd-type quinol oxidase subunit 2
MTVERHLDLLGLLLIVSGVLCGLAALSLLALAAGAAVLIRSDGEIDVAASFAAGLFVGLALALFAYGAACAVTGRGLRRHQPWSRTAGLLLSLVNLFVPPFGTALGAYAFWILLRERSRQLLGVV